MFELSIQQQKMISGGSVYTDMVKVAEWIAPNAVKAVPVVGQAATALTAADLAISGYKNLTNDPAAQKAAQDKAIQEAVHAEIKRMQEEEARKKQEQLDDEFLERRLHELQNKRSEEGQPDVDSYAGGHDVDYGGDWGGGGGGGGGGGHHEMAEDSFSNWA